MSDVKKVYQNLGQLKVSKKDNEGDADKFFLQFGRRKDKDGKFVGEDKGLFPLVINEGDTINLYSVVPGLEKAVAEGKLDKSVADSIRQFVKFDMVRTVKDGQATTARPAKKSDINF